METAREILASRKRYALLGASGNPEKYSFRLLETLRGAGYTVAPVNPRYTEIQGQTCYPSLDALPQRPEVAICALAPRNTEQVIEQVADAGIDILWMPPECGSDDAVAEARRLGLSVVHDVCPMGLLLRLQAEQG